MYYVHMHVLIRSFNPLNLANSYRSYDAFMLEPVAEHLLDNFNFVAGIVPVLTTHIKKVYSYA